MLGSLYNLTARAMVDIHSGLAHVFGARSFASWALSIVLLVMSVRLVLVPAFIKQIKSQRTMQMLQPKMKELREKHKNDKETMNKELMKLQSEHGNPLLGCLPIFIQIPLFLALFRVMSGMRPKFFKVSDVLPVHVSGCGPVTGGQYCFIPSHGLTAATVHDIANAKAFGVSISAAFLSPTKLLHFLGANAAAVRSATVVLIVLMTASTFLTQKQMMKRSGPPTDANQATTQKLLLYLGPGFLAVFGFQFPVGVLLYWLTTNFWSLGQQHVILSRMPPVVAGSPGVTLRPEVGRTGGGPAPGIKPIRPQQSALAAGAASTGSDSGAIPGIPKGPAKNGRAGGPSRTRKKAKGGRRGGRR